MSHSPSNYTAGLLVRYIGPTDTKGSRWQAAIIRGTGAHNRYRATVPYSDGPDSAARAVVSRFNECLSTNWKVSGPAISLDGGGTYAYPVSC